MRSVKEKVSNAASAAQEHVDIYKAQVQEKAEKATARTTEEKVIAHEKMKAKEAEAKMKLHEAKAEHAAEKLYGKHHLHQHDPVLAGTTGHVPVGTAVASGQTGHHLPGQGHHHHQPVGTVGAGVPAPAPTYPLGANPPGHNNYI
ncbi:Seed maturation protein [Heracleum sosnowskyi]|uniref:Seed maturation protein n=1 Tax=Heracleum sosnowskyi TaxID=360622 RepID=A0AAD8GYW5_9APIA|nr:Seed maturation protein [Heracleum sosnowskyi]